MPGDGTGNSRISPVTFYGVFLKNKVNKTWYAEARILIICLQLWGRRGDAAREKERRGQGRRESEKGEMSWNTQTSVTWRCGGARGRKHAAAFRCDRGRCRKEAGWYEPEQCWESAKHSLLKIQQQCLSITTSSMYLWNVLIKIMMQPIKL